MCRGLSDRGSSDEPRPTLMAGSLPLSAGGSVAGGMDHVVVAMGMKNAGGNPTDVKYVPYDAGGKAMAGLLSGEIQALSTGFGEAVELAKQDQVRILCVTAKARLDVAKDVPTCDEAGAT